MVLRKFVLFLKPWKFCSDLALYSVRVIYKILVPDIEKTIVAEQWACTGMQFTPKPNVRVVHILALTVPANDDITRIARYVNDIEIRIVDDSWHVQRIFGSFRDNHIVVFCGYEVKANLMVIMLVYPKTGDHHFVQESSTGSRRAGNNVNVLKQTSTPRGIET